MDTSNPPRAIFLKVAWLSILLGLGMEILLLAAAGGFGAIPAVKLVIANLAQKITWSFFVCAGLAFGAAAAKARVPAMGFAGLVSAPIAFILAKGLHKGALEALSVAGVSSSHPSAFLLATIKAVEYGCLGVLIGWVGKQAWGGVRAHASAGLFLGIIFGGMILYLTVQGAPNPPAMAALVSKGINEILFPVGCSMVLFSAQHLSRRKI